MKKVLIIALFVAGNVCANSESKLSELKPEANLVKEAGTFNEFKDSYRALFNQEPAQEWEKQADWCENPVGACRNS